MGRRHVHRREGDKPGECQWCHRVMMLIDTPPNSNDPLMLCSDCHSHYWVYDENWAMHLSQSHISQR